MDFANIRFEAFRFKNIKLLRMPQLKHKFTLSLNHNVLDNKPGMP